MAANIGVLVAKVMADTAGFVVGMTSVRKELADTTAGVGKAGGAFGGLVPVIDPVGLAIKGVGAAFDLIDAGITAVADSIGASFDRIQEIGNTAQSLSMTTEAFQTLAIAADQADVEIATLKKGIFEMEKSLAAGGSSEKALGSIGLTLKELKGLSPEKQFEKIADALQDVTDQDTRVAAIADLFGKSGIELKRLFDGGGESIQAAREQLERMGGGISALDVERIGKWDSAWKELQGTIAGITNDLTSDLAPIITELIQATTDWLQSDAGKNFIADSIAAITEGARVAAVVAERLIGLLQDIMAGLHEMAQLAMEVEKFFGGGPPEIVGATDEARRKAEQFRKNKAEQMKADAGIDVPGDKVEDVSKEVEKLLDSLKTPFDHAKEAILRLDELFTMGALDTEQFTALRDKELDKLAKSVQKPESFSNPAMTAGSQAAIKFLADAKYGNSQQKTFDAMRKSLEEIVKNTREQEPPMQVVAAL